MIPPDLARLPDGSLVLSDLAPWFVTVLLELPDLLAPDQPGEVLRRLYPEPGEEEEKRKDWDRLVRPELFALVASARQVLENDLQELKPQKGGGSPALWSVTVPRAHVAAWISALNAARLTLGARHKIEEGDMERDQPPEDWGDREVAVAKIYLYGILQQMLIEEESPPEDQPGYPGTGE